MTQPRIKVPFSQIDYLFVGLGFIALIILLSLPLYFFQKLPAEIPSHFGLSGEADAIGPKKQIWVLPILGVVMFVVMLFLSLIPHRFNYLSKVTKENVAAQYQFARKAILSSAIFILFTFAYITWATIQTALGNQAGLSIVFMIGFVITVLAMVTFALIKASQFR